MARLDRSLIAGAPAFAGPSADALDEILGRAEILRLLKGETAFRQGDKADRFFLLLHGRLRVTRINAQGAQILVRFVAPNDLFGVAMAIGAAAYPGTATAATESLALAWPNASWAELIATYPSLAVQAMQSRGARLQDTQDRVLELSTRNVERRIAGAVHSSINHAPIYPALRARRGQMRLRLKAPAQVMAFEPDDLISQYLGTCQRWPDRTRVRTRLRLVRSSTTSAFTRHRACEARRRIQKDRALVVEISRQVVTSEPHAFGPKLAHRKPVRPSPPR